MTSASVDVPTRRVDLRFAGTAAQNRVTVTFRIILAIPQFIVLYFLCIAAFVVAVIGWFAALFTGELPRVRAHLPERDHPLGDTRERLLVPLDRRLPAFLARRRGLPGADGPARAWALNRVVRALPHHPGHPGVRLLPDRPVRAHGPVALRHVVRRLRHREMPPSLYAHLHGPAALPGPPQRVAHHDHVGVRLGNAGRLGSGRHRLYAPSAPFVPPAGAAPASTAAVPGAPAPPTRRRPTVLLPVSARRQVPTPPPAGHRASTPPVWPPPQPAPKSVAPRVPCPRRRRGSARPPSAEAPRPPRTARPARVRPGPG